MSNQCSNYFKLYIYVIMKTISHDLMIVVVNFTFN